MSKSRSLMVLAAIMAVPLVLQDAKIAASQNITLDDFTNPFLTPSSITTSGTGLGTTTDAATGGDPILGDRDRRVSSDDTSAGGTLNSDILGILGSDNVSASPLGSQSYVLVYDCSTDSTGETDAFSGTFGSFAAAIDFTTNARSALRFNLTPTGSISQGAGFHIDVRVLSSGGSSTFTSPNAPFGGTGSNYEIPFASFTGTADFTDVTALIVQFDDLATTNFELDSIETVPEPGTVLGTVGAVCLGAGLAFKHRKRLVSKFS